jgi:hypothetical protein
VILELKQASAQSRSAQEPSAPIPNAVGLENNSRSGNRLFIYITNHALAYIEYFRSMKNAGGFLNSRAEHCHMVGHGHTPHHQVRTKESRIGNDTTDYASRSITRLASRATGGDCRDPDPASGMAR